MRSTRLIIVLGLIGLVVFVLIHEERTIVTRTEQGFVPSRVVVSSGDTVVFRSMIDTEYWPASDAHPTHGLYPELDPGRALAVGEEWEFTFEDIGIWRIHDHLKPNVRASIIVVGDSLESAESCVLSEGGTIQPQCWEPQLTLVLRDGGLEAGFDAVRAWYERSPDFRRNCHDVLHVLGAEAYRLYTKNHTVSDRSETSYCGYGFYHGFVETMLLEQGPGHFEDVLAYCESLRGVRFGAVGPCYHGIGHAVFDSLDSALWGDDEAMTREALGVCEQEVGGEWEQVRCASGVFNALANANSARTYGLSYGNDEKIPICAEQKRSYWHFCFAELGNGLVRDKQWGRQREIAFINAIEDNAARASVVLAYMNTEVRQTIDRPDTADLALLCMVFRNRNDVEACIAGTFIGFEGMSVEDDARAYTDAFCADLTTHTDVSCNPRAFLDRVE